MEDLPVPIAGDLEETENGDASAEEPSSEDEPEPEESLQEEGEQEDAVQKTEEEVPEGLPQTAWNIRTPCCCAGSDGGAGKANVRMSMKQGDTFFYLPKTSEIPPIWQNPMDLHMDRMSAEETSHLLMPLCRCILICMM